MAGDDLLPPQDLDAERSVLGAMLLEPACIDSVSQLVRVDQFYQAGHRTLFGVLLAMHLAGKPVDVVAVAYELQRQGQLDEVGGPAGINAILETVPHVAHAEHYAGIVRHLSDCRRVIDWCQQAARKSQRAEDLDELMASVEAEFQAIREPRQQASTLSEVLVDVVMSMESAAASGVSPGLPTGLVDLDDKVGGIRPAQMVTIGARPGAGKTALLVTLMQGWAKRGHGVLVISLEMTKAEITGRLLAQVANQPYRVIVDGTADHSGKYAIELAGNDIANYPIQIDDRPGLTLEDITATARYWKRKANIEVLCIDHMGLIKAHAEKFAKSLRETTTDHAIRMKQLAKSLDIPVILLCQLNRQVESRKGADRRPRMSDLREAGAIEENSDHVWLLHRESMYLDESDSAYRESVGKADLFVEKNRNGPTGRIKLQFNGETMAFRNLAEGYYGENF